MRFSIDQAAFLNGVQTVQRAISTKNVLPPILSGIYLEAGDGKLILRATDLEIGIESVLPATVSGEGAVVLPARYFTEIVRKLPAMEITVEEADNGQVRISYGKSEILLNAYDADEFPALQDFRDDVSFEISQSRLTSAIRNVSIAASVDYSRPIFTGILLEMVDGKLLKMVATDTHRLAYCEVQVDAATVEDSLSLIVPSRSLNELGRIFSPEEEAMVRIVVDENKILFETENIRITSRLIEGKFVNYRQVIPESWNTRVRMLRKPFYDALDRASLLSRDDLSKKKLNTVKMVIDEGAMEISSKSAQIGELEEKVPVHLEGERLEIGFNSRYLLDVLRVMDQEEIVLDLSSPLSPGIIRPLEENNNTLFLVLPIRLG